MKLRDAVEADLPAIVEIYNSTVPTHMVTADTEPVSVESRLAWFHEHDPLKHPIWVTEDVGEIASWLSFEPFHKRSEARSQDPDRGRLRPQRAELPALRGLRLRALGALSEGGGAGRHRAGSRPPRPEIRQSLKGEER